jgi:hypothetical protein
MRKNKQGMVDAVGFDRWLSMPAGGFISRRKTVQLADGCTSPPRSSLAVASDGSKGPARRGMRKPPPMWKPHVQVTRRVGSFNDTEMWARRAYERMQQHAAAYEVSAPPPQRPQFAAVATRNTRWPDNGAVYGEHASYPQPAFDTYTHTAAMRSAPR